MFKYISLLLFFTQMFLLSSFGFSSEPSQNRQKEKADTVTYIVDTINTRVSWSCNIHHGFVPLESGTLEVVKNNIVSGRVIMKMDSVSDIDIDYDLMRKTLLNTMRSKDFLNTGKYPYATFTIDEVDHRNDSTLITGDLTFLGVTKCISFLSAFTVKGDSVFAESEKIVIDRTDFGNITMSKDDTKSDKSFIVPNEVIIQVFLKGVKAR